MKKALIVALIMLLVGVTASALEKSDFRGGVFWTDRHNAVIGGITSTGYFEPLLGLNFLDDIDLSFGGTAGGTAGPLSVEWTTADANANCFLIDFPTGGLVDVPVLILASSDTNFGYFNGTVEPTLAVENLVGTSWIALDHSATTLARLQAGGAATFLTIATELAGADIVLDANDAAANTAQQYVSITGTIPAHASGTPTDIFLDITPTIGINTSTATVHLIDLSFTTPVWGSGAATSTVSGIYLAPTIGAATAGTNTVNMIEIANYTGDAQVNVTGINIGTSDGLGTANAISINTGWTAGIDCNSPVTLSHADADLDVEDNITAGDIIIDEPAGVLSFTGATSATISTSTAAAGIFFDAADQTSGNDKSYVTISGTTPAHVANTPTNIFLDINPTTGINTVDTNTHLIDMAFTSPAWATAVTSNYRAIYIQPGIGDAAAGTNTVNMIEIGSFTGDAQVTTHGIAIGTLSGTAADEYGVRIYAGWDYGIYSQSGIMLAHTTAPDLILDNTTTGSDADSGYTTWRGNDGAADTELDMSVFLDIESITDYKLSFMDDGKATEKASIDQDGNAQFDGTGEWGGNVTVTNATNTGSLYVSQFTIIYTQTASYTACVIPANADVTKVEVITTTAFSGGSATTIDVGYVGTLEAYAGDLNIRTAGFADCDVFSNLGDVGGSDVTMKAQIATDDSAGSCTVYFYWTMGAPGTP